MGGKKAVHEFTNLCIKCYLWVLFLRFVAMKLQYSGRNNIKTHCSIFWDNSVQVRCLSQKEFSFIWFLINGFSFPFVISHCVQIFILMWQTTHNLVLLQEGFVYIDTDEISQIKSRKGKYHLFIDWLICGGGHFTLHSNTNIKRIPTIFGPGGAITIAIGNPRHTVHWYHYRDAVTVSKDSWREIHTVKVNMAV